MSADLRDEAQGLKGLVVGLGLMALVPLAIGAAMAHGSFVGWLFVAFLSVYLPVSFVRERRHIAVQREAGWPERKAWQDKRRSAAS